MQKTSVFNGNFSTLHEEDSNDIFIDIVGVLMKGFEFEMNERYDLDYVVSAKNRIIVVTTEGNKTLFLCRMIECEKVSSETLIDKQKLMSEFGIPESEWIAVLENEPKLRQTPEPMKRVFRYQIELTELESQECQEFFEIGLELLQNIQ